MRANHYHPQQEQKCLFTKGQIIEIFQDIVNPNSPKVTQVVNEGQLSIIKPNVAHSMVFSKDTTFLNLVRGERDHENYGITHTIKHNFVDENEKKTPKTNNKEKPNNICLSIFLQYLLNLKYFDLIFSEIFFCIKVN